MANALGLYDPLFYAQEALIQLEKNLGMAARVHRGYDKEPQQKGSTIQIRRPSVFTAQDMPGTAQDLLPEAVSIVLDQWKGVRFKLTDKEATYTTDQIITEHIRPASYALADAIDLSMVVLYRTIPWVVTADATPTDVSDFTDVWQRDRKSTRLNSSHLGISYAVF